MTDVFVFLLGWYRPGYSASESVPSSSAVSSHVSHAFTCRGEDRHTVSQISAWSKETLRYLCKFSKKYLGTKTRLMLPERELFLCQDASRLHLLSTSKTLLLPQLPCRTATQTYATTCLGKNRRTISQQRYPISVMQSRNFEQPKLSDRKASSETEDFPISLT